MRNAYRCPISLLAMFVLLLGFPQGAARAQTEHERALAVYEEGKKSYDAGDFVTARRKFNEAAKIEPNHARWFYNLGLAHRQLGDENAAREALLRARTLDPDYKRAEIDQKLAGIRAGPISGGTADTASGDAVDTQTLLSILGAFAITTAWIVLPIVAGVVAIRLILRRIQGNRQKRIVESDNMRRRIDAAARQLVPVEHALRFSEDADVRSQLDYATRAEHALRRQLAEARTGNDDAMTGAMAAVASFEEASARAVDQARKVFGPAALTPGGKRVGCYFCARPLANADYRRMVSLKRGSAQNRVLSCPECADRAARGDVPDVLESADGKAHWSELPDFDPYAARHAEPPGLRRVPVWRHAPKRSLAEVALLAAGAAMAGGALAAMLRSDSASDDAYLLDLDSAEEAGLAQEATRAAAKRAQAQRSESDSRDHS